MIVEVTYEGGGVFKVFPVPNDPDVKVILTAIRLIDPSNAEEGSCSHGTPFRYACPECSDEDEGEE